MPFLRLAMDADGQTLLALREHSFFRGPPDTLGEAQRADSLGVVRSECRFAASKRGMADSLISSFKGKVCPPLGMRVLSFGEHPSLPRNYPPTFQSIYLLRLPTSVTPSSFVV